MTHEKWIALTPEQQRIKVAELCGWKYIRKAEPKDTRLFGGDVIPNRDLMGLPQHDTPGATAVFGDQKIPECLTDLNTMHEAEMKLDENQQIIYAAIIGRSHYDAIYRVSQDYHFFDVIYPAMCASAAERAEAFVLTLEPE
jgi:hypothetical protein